MFIDLLIQKDEEDKHKIGLKIGGWPHSFTFILEPKVLRFFKQELQHALNQVTHYLEKLDEKDD